SRASAYNLSLHEQARGFSHKFNIPYSAVAYGSGSTDTVTVTLGALPANWVINNALVNVSTAFAGTTAFTVQVGTTTSSAAFVTATSVLSAGVIGSPLSATLTNATGTASANLVATFTNATGGSPSALTAGALDIYLNIVDLSGAGPKLG
ncbi:hypothetical protein, partial [Undibacterium luofuense]|uniref:hypothetical protein n=1 Tax=Undibacterium luofuense TaxID=2828733 RepID=UPI0030EE197A